MAEEEIYCSTIARLRGQGSRLTSIVAPEPTGPDRELVATHWERRIAASAVRELCGGVSDMTLWRWLHDPEMNFPQPIYIGKRRYWRAVDLITWLETRALSSRNEA